MWNWLVPLIVIVLSIAILCVLVYKKFPQIGSIDTEALPKERERRLKQQLILSRLSRTRERKMGKVSQATHEAVKSASRVGRRAVQRLYALEQYYKKIQKTQGEGSRSLDAETVKRLMREAEEDVRQEEFIPAEKRYIEIISHNPKEINAYEGLGNLYMRSRQFKQARESFLFALRLNPDDASVHMSLGELEQLEDHPADALASFKKAVERRPGNPKYLDAYIECALDVGDEEQAKKGIEQMKSVNKENSKILFWEERLLRLDSISRGKVHSSQNE